MCKEKMNVNVEFEDGRKVVVKEGTLIGEVIPDRNKYILGVNINNENKSLFHKVISDSYCRYITYDIKEGRRIYGRTLKFVFLAAVKILFGDKKVQFTNKNGNDYFANIKGVEINDNVVSNLKEIMQKIIQSDFRIRKIQGRKEEIKRYYINMNSLEQISNLDRLEMRKKYTINFFEDRFEDEFGINYYNYLYGNLALSTGYIKSFDLLKYKSGIALVLPQKDDINKIKEKFVTNRIFELSDEFMQICKKTEIYNVTDLNERNINYDIQEVIRLAEYDSDNRINKIAEQIITRKNIKFVFLSGPSSSGKTTTAQKLSDFLKLLGKKSKVISMDNFFMDEENIPVRDGKKDYECLENIDLELFKEDINALLDKRKVVLPTYNFKEVKKEYVSKPYELSEDGILIIEGIHALNPKVYSFIPKENIFKIYVAPIVTLGLDSYSKLSTSDLRIVRRMVRDFEKRNIGCEKTLELWKDVVNSEEKNIFPYVDLADCILNTNLIYEWGVLKDKACFLLLKVKNTSNNYAEARRIYQLLQNFIGIEEKYVPITSILREFIGNGCYLC